MERAIAISLIQIQSNRQCLSFLERASGNGARDKELGKHELLTPWFDKAESLLGQFKTAMKAQMTAHSLRVEENGIRRAAANAMIRVTRDFRSTLQRRVAREGEPDVVLTYYRMPHLISPVNADDWAQLCEWCLDGEAMAVGKGFPAMVNPSAEQLQTALDQFRAVRISADASDRVYQEAQEQLTRLRREANTVSRGLASNLRLLLEDKDASTVRRIMRSYGFRFRGSVDETEGSGGGTGGDPVDATDPTDAGSGDPGTGDPVDGGGSDPAGADTGETGGGGSDPVGDGGTDPADTGGAATTTEMQPVGVAVG